jgi:hypothetical protein
VQRDLYSVLGCPQDAPAADLRRAYRRSVRRVHPDVGGDPAAFREVQEAWEVLGDPSGRAAYDTLSRDVSVELAAAFERARAAVVHPPPSGPSPRDIALVRGATLAAVLGVVAVLVALGRDVDGLVGLATDAVLFSLLPAAGAALLSARLTVAGAVAGAGAATVAARGGGDALVGGAMLLGAALGLVAAVLMERR